LKIKAPPNTAEALTKRERLESEALNKLDQDKAEEYASASQKRAMYVTKVGAVANLALAISKGTVGYAISSTGLIADAANSLGDLLSDFVVYYSVTEARKRATPDRPWGRGKVEPLGKLTSDVVSLAV
jgi:divalent metal cation (Fe/Co/Zn/Cd) transporter